MATKKYDYNRTLAEADFGYAKTRATRNNAQAKSRMNFKTSDASYDAKRAKANIKKNKLEPIPTAPSKPKKLVSIKSVDEPKKVDKSKLVSIKSVDEPKKVDKSKLVSIKKAVVKPSAAKRKTTKNIKK